MNSLFKLKFKMHKLVNIIFYLIVFLAGFLLGLTINSVSAEELESTNTHVVCRDSVNLFNKDNVSIGYLTEDGSLSGEDIYRTSDFIEVIPNTTYHKTETSSSRLKLYDVNKKPLSNSYSDIAGSGNISFTIPENAYYLRVSLTIDHLDSLQIELGDTATEYEPYGKQICEVIISGDNMFYDISKNIVGKLDSKDFWVYDLVTCFLAISGLSIIVVVVLSIFKLFVRG